MDTRPPTTVPADEPLDHTQVLPRIVDTDHVPAGPDAPAPSSAAQTALLGAAAEVEALTQDAQTQINPDDLARPWNPTWSKAGTVTEPKPRGVAVGVPGPDSVSLDPSKVDFTSWAADWLADTAPQVQAKAEQYGSNSLAAMGHLAGRMQGRQLPQVVALEAGCAMYAFGKMERVMDAMLRGELPSRDTWNDLAVYSLMVLYMRQTGRWP